MKSLKRTLCLVLALVMVLGLFGIASATSFTDDNTIQYKEAVDVMTGIGAISGYTDGTFNPKGTITRAEAAKLVTYAVLGKATADALTGVSSSFTDVTAANYGWAIPSIEYLVKAGVINGMGDGTFNPNGEISSVATLKMLLCALGYGKKGEYTGTSWDFQATLDANKYGLTDGRTGTASVNAPATREEVALYCFNTIQKPLVEYVSSLDIYAGGGSLGINKGTIQSAVYEENKSGGLKDDDSTPNAFGAPAVKWTYKGKEIGTYASTPSIHYTGAQTADAVTADLKAFTVPNVAVWDATLNNNAGGWKDGYHVHINGDDDSGHTRTSTYNGAAGLVKYLTAEGTGLTGNGVVVDIYTKDNAVTDVVVIRTDLAKVDVVDTLNKEVTLTTVTATAKRGNPNYTITAKDDTELYPAASALKKDDMVLVTYVGTKAAAIAAPTPVVGKISNVSIQGVVTLEGKTYGTSYSFGGETAVANVTKDVTALLDGYGYLIFAKKADEATTDVVYVLETHKEISSNGRIIEKATVLHTNGTTEVVTADADITTPTTTPVQTMIASTTVPGAYTFAASATKDAADTTGPVAKTGFPLVAGQSLTATARSLPNGICLYNTSSNANNNFASRVKFIYLDAANNVVGVKDGVQALTVPAAGSTHNGAYAIFEANSKTDATVVVTAVVVKGALPTDATGNLVYITKKLSEGSIAVGTSHMTTYAYEAYKDGAKTEPVVTVAPIDAANMNNFFTLSSVSGMTGISAATKVDSDTAVGSVTVATGSLLQADKANFFGDMTMKSGDDLKDVHLAAGRIVDLRPAGSLPRIAATAEGLAKAMQSINLKVSTVYTTNTKNAVVTYITDAGTYTVAAPTQSGAASGQNAVLGSVPAFIESGSSFSFTVKTLATMTNNKLQLTVTGTGATATISGGALTAGTDITSAASTLAVDTTYTITVTAGSANITALTLTFSK